MHEFLLTFQTTHQALLAEKRMKSHRLVNRLIPTPTEIFSECGFSLELSLSREDLDPVLAGELFPFAECYLITTVNKEKTVYEKIHP